jgi:hypothetical protein
MPRNDFVHVQLSERGRELAGEHPLRISNGRRSIALKAGETAEVERSYEWNAFLSKHTHHDGEALFELAPAAANSSNIPATAATSEE